MNFLLRYGNFLLFVLLEGFSLYLVSQYNKKQNEIYQSSANLLVGTVYDNFSSVRKFFSIQEIADSLAKENAELKSQLEASKYVTIDQRGTVAFPVDTSSTRIDTVIGSKEVIQEFTFMAAEVIKNSTMREENYLTINRGSNHGVKPGMGVISSKGVVGVVKNVTAHFSQIVSILNSSLQVSAKIKRTRFLGSLKWHSESEQNNHDPRFMVLEGVPKHADVVQGDTIITSGYSNIFPGGLLIGRVENIRILNGNNFYTLDVALWDDLSIVQYVYVVDNLMIKEFDALYEEPKKDIKRRR